MYSHAYSLVGYALVAILLSGGYAKADEIADSFHKAYYLEVEEGQLEAAIKLYRQVMESPSAPADLVARARARLEACSEDLRSRDLARLMPPDAMFYAELRDPGQHLSRILKLAGFVEPAEDVPASPSTDDRGGSSDTSPFTISPRLLREIGEVAGAAIAITDIDFHSEVPEGVIAIHPGRSDLVHGFVESFLSGAAASGEIDPGDSVSGHATYLTPVGTVVLTDRLILAGHPHQLVVDAVGRLESAGPLALDTAPVFAELKSKRERALVFAFADAPRLLQRFKEEISRHQGRVPQEYRIMQAFGDLESMRWVAATLASHDRGVSANVWARFEEDNSSLVYHLARTPALSAAALESIPAGVAAFAGVGISGDLERGAPAAAGALAARHFTGLDVGRELFTNVEDALVFVLPPAKESERPMPDVGVILRVNDSAQSRQIWEEFLALPSKAGARGFHPPRREEIHGYACEVHEFPEGIRIYLAALPDRVVLATTRAAVDAALGAAADESRRLGSDDALARLRQGLSGSANKVIAIHGGRLLQVVEPLLRFEGERIPNQVAKLVSDSSLTAFTEETYSSLRVSLTLDPPDIGALLEKELEKQRMRNRRRAARRHQERHHQKQPPRHSTRSRESSATSPPESTARATSAKD